MKRAWTLALLLTTTACYGGISADELAIQQLKQAREALEGKIEACDRVRTTTLPPDELLSELREYPAEQVQQFLVSLSALNDYRCQEPENSKLVFVARAIANDDEVSDGVREKAASTARSVTSRYFAFVRLHNASPEGLLVTANSGHLKGPYDAMVVLGAMNKKSQGHKIDDQ